MNLKYNIIAITVAVLVLGTHSVSNPRQFESEKELEEFLNNVYEKEASSMCQKQVIAEWDFATDVNNKTKEEVQLAVTLESAEFSKTQWEKYFYDLKPEDFTNTIIQRQVKQLRILGNAALDPEKLKELTTVGNTMTNIYSTAKICPFKKQDCDIETEGLSLEPEVESIMASSTNYKELAYAWEKWRDASGAKIKPHYNKYVELSNEAAKANHFNDLGEMWISSYESPMFIGDMDKLWQQVKPLYNELHRYVRNKLKGRYGDEIDLSDGLIPAHVLGNMWAQSWSNLYPLVIPFPDASSVDVTAALKEQNYTVLKMFQTADEFYTSLGLFPNDICYNVEKGAMIVKPEDRDVLCHASAWDFCDGENYRVKMCTEVNYEDFITIHHEMGHIQYYLQYKKQPITLRTGANPGFHEAVGDTIALSVATPKHLKEIGLLKDYEDDHEASINTLMNMALERVAFLPFGLLIDKWRWDVFAGRVTEEEWNSHWWYYRNSIQKVKSPIPRSDMNDFDPGAKYHIAGGSQYINYFVAHILEFQLYRGLCKAAGQYDPKDPNKPLFKCDYYRSKEAGNRLKDGLSLGSTEHWKYALEKMTGEKDLDASAILDYFQPLYQYLKNENGKLSEDELTNFLKDEYEPLASSVFNKQVTADWNFVTDINNKEKEKAKVQATLDSAEFSKLYWDEYFHDLNENDYKDESLKKQIKSLKVLGNAALDTEKLTELTNVENTMSNIYSTAKVCPFNKQDCDIDTEGLSLEPDLESIMGSSRDYDELTYIWNAWREASGAEVKKQYPKYVSLSNEAAKANGFKDKGEFWREDYDSPTFISDLDKLWEQVKPLYEELHKYVGKKMKDVYGNKINIEDGLIPANILGNMWAQSWYNLSPLVRPYPEASSIDVTKLLIEQNFTILKMFETSDEFYQSLGLEPNDMSYDVNLGAVIEKPSDREISCHAYAYDFSNKRDFRIKMCTEVNYEDFITVHHEMGHIQYFIQYKDQPISFRNGANPGFHEAVGDTIALSVATAQHLENIGLLKDYQDSDESAINTLMDMALQRVAFLPFGLLVDKWRWDVFEGKVKEDEWNSHWWKYRQEIQKVKPPVPRSDLKDFDPGAKFQISAGTQYINYFVAHILEFQLYRGLCIASGQYDPAIKDVPLHKCDFYQSINAGNKLSAGLSLGSSKHWKVALEAMTGERDLDASALLDYFDPLLKYLKEQNRMTEQELQKFLNEYETDASTVLNKQVTAEWNYATDINNSTKEEEQLNCTLETAEFDKYNWNEHFRYLKEEDYTNEALQRQVKSLKVLGDAALNTDKLTELTNIGNNMTNIYSTAKICPFNYENCNVEEVGLSLEPDLVNIMATSKNYDELSYVWEAWRKVSGSKMKDQYSTYVSLSNEAALLNGFKDKGEMWREDYESPSFIEDMDKLWKQVKPLYNQLHKYVGKKLKAHYGDKMDIKDGLIPAHLLGNMWAQSWINLSPLVKPYPNASSVDVTAALKEQNYTVLRMFATSDEFYQSLGLPANDMSYDNNRGAVIEKPIDREILCHASAWDFSDKTDFRIKMCTEVNYEDFITIHHEMGHIQYFIQYKNQPVTFRDGANPGFHEAIGDTIALSVATPKHLEKINLLKDYEDSNEAAINTLMDMALERVAFLPFGLLIDKWRWDVFAGDVEKESWNSHWWKYREEIQKVKAPVVRSDTTDFDPGAKYHVPGDSQYINYFVAHILEFQLYRGLCKAAGEYDPENKQVPLHKCDFYQSKAAGAKLSAGLSLGSSKHWKDALEAMTGERNLDATAILEYFEPLLKYLEKENNMSEEELEDFLNEYETDASAVLNKQVIAEWNFATDVNNPIKEEEQLNTTLETAEFDKSNWNQYFKNLDENDYESESLQRQVKFLKVLGNAALDTDKLTELTNIGNSMTNIYSTAKICPFNNKNCKVEEEGLSLEPDLVSIMATSKNYDELSYVWEAWRDVSGHKMKDQYSTYVSLSNEAAALNGFEDKGEMWREDYESPAFIDDMDELWNQVKPLYDQLHTYVGKKLKAYYGDQMDIKDGLIPAHLLGNMWAQSWINLSPLVKPYPNASSIDVTAALKEQNYTVLKMFATSDEFYQSLGLPANDMSYDINRGAVIEKPIDREILCHASAWDFSDKTDFRIKMCTEVNYEDFITIHHEMGHIQYFIQYKNQPVTFRDGANPGFHEAIGDTIALSVATPKHLEKINLLKDYEDSDEAAINTLMDMALERVAFLPFGLLIDKWRWDVFAGDVGKENWNSHWWKYREEIQKVKAPVVRSDTTDFDPGAKYHVPGDSQYINYFVAHILEFQLYRGLCKAAGEYDPENKQVPLHKCDFYQSKAAGAQLSAGLSLGSSKHWKDALEAMTGERNLDATAILEYFEPLLKYLEKENNMSEEELEDFLNEYETDASAVLNKQVIAEWNFATDVNNPIKEEEQLNTTLETAEFDKSNWNQHFKNLDENDYESESLQRQVKFLKVLGNAALDTDKLTELTNIGNNMTNIYSIAKICPFNNQKCKVEEEGLSLEPDLVSIMATSKNYDELSYVWEAWRSVSGRKIKDQYSTYVSLSNEAAALNGFEDKGEMWREDYESPAFIDDMDKLWNQVKPLYNQLHKYVGKKLKAHYGDKMDIKDGLIPAHLLGNMWAQSWINLSPLVKPYPNASSIDVTAALKDQNYTVVRMFATSDEFYQSLGLPANDMSYDVNRGAVIEKPKDREILCHASAWDFSDKTDFRIKMCTEVNYEDFITIYHEMGHIQYFIQYKKQPVTFRDGANPGFHQAIGDTIALSVATPKHLEKINLLKDYEDSDEAAINTLMDMALERVAFLPFGLLIDKWRWDVFAGDVGKKNWNSHWWKYREEIQKVKAPVVRSDTTDFDPGAKYHVPGDSQYINYFVAHILEFQLYRGLCKAAGEYDPENKQVPLHKCDFYQSKAAGAKLSAGLSLGSSKHWKDALEAMTGERNLDATAILEYFDPLLRYLENEDIMNEEELEDFLKEYETDASLVLNKQVTAEWNFATDVNNPIKEEEQLNATLETAEFDKSNWNKHFKNLDESDYKSEALRRQVTRLKVLGNAALDTEKLTELTNTGSYMTNLYSTAKICPFDNQMCDVESEGLSLEPDLENILATSTNYEELSYVWEAWRDETGAKMKKQYATHVSLSNEAAVLNGFKDKGEMWREDYESPSFVKDMDKLWNKVKPLYDQLHMYVGKKLKERYGGAMDLEDGLIPAHLLGNMWAQSWINLSPLVKPFPNASSIDVTKELKEQNYTVLRMFETSDEFYQSLGLESNSMSYDVSRGAVIEKPKDREILCHASAWDFSDKKDFRIKMCTKVNYEDFITIHHEMGHIQYFIQYKNQPVTFRDGANPGFHEAVGDTIALSVATPRHLDKIGLLGTYQDSHEASINTLMDMALERVAFLPFGLLIDKWRWDVFAGDVEQDQWNAHWWKYREKIQKVKAPVRRSDETDFDPGAKYHVPGDSQYINYFVAHILEFQLYRGLCKTAGEYYPGDKERPLHKCDFYQSQMAGTRLTAGLSLGASKHWKEVLYAMTGEQDLDATAILEYFEPLMEYLTEQNAMNEEELAIFLTEYEEDASVVLNKQVVADWDYTTDIDNPIKEEQMLKTTLETAEYNKNNWNNYFRNLNEENYKNETLKRQVKFLKVLGNAALDADDLEELTRASNNMTNIYSTAKICPYEKQKCSEKEGLELEPQIQAIFATSSNYDELAYVWKSWRDATGAKMKDDYRTYVNLSNDAAKANGFLDKGEMWRSDYESPTFIKDMDRLWEKVKPLYNELHKYVAKKLKTKYGDRLDISDGLLPAHVLGNMWAQSWNNLASFVKPYPEESPVDVTGALIAKGYTVLDMFDTADDFYKSLGLESSSMSYDVNRGAIIVKPPDRKILCHASAWDFSNKEDFRIKMCTEVNYEDFITIHHEMGHIQYFILYKDQPISFRDGANPGFHEAIGDTIALSVATPQHLETIGLLDGYEDSDKAAINSLMDMALERVAFLPFGLLIDKWRWDVFAGLPSEQWNSQWWRYRKSIQKIKAPVPRSDLTDFDPGAKYHVPGDSQYINYFVAHILEFQLYRALCKDKYNPGDPKLPLHKCDFYNSKEAGAMLRKGLSLGSSKHWKEVLTEMTGETDLDATALLEYFDPLFKYLKQENGPITDEKELRSFLRIDYEPGVSHTQNDQVTAEWNYQTDVNNPSKQQEQVDATLRSAEFTKFYYANYFKDLKEEDFNDETILREISFLKRMGNAALDNEKLEELTNAVLTMTNIYSTARVCPYHKQVCNLPTEGLTLEPEIEDIMAKSTDYNELKYYWEMWYNIVGRPMKSEYPKYVELSNEAAVANGFNDKGEMWRSDYESETFITDVDKLWEEVKPLYDELHEYVGHKLKERYGNELDISDGLIPAHVFGNMWAQTWGNLYSLVKPFPKASSVDVTSALLEQNYSVYDMFETSDKFYQSLGLESNSMSYNEELGAIIEKPDDRDIVCHASAWDFSDGKDFRIKMCSNVNYEDFTTVHHEMGHIQYFILYKDQPAAFRTGANPGFHEAVGDTIVLSVTTPQHLEKIHLLKDYKDSNESAINSLMETALERIAFLPFGLLIDKWRWDVFSGKVTNDKWNSHWWLYRESLQKVKAPVKRDDTDFDPGAKYHVPADSQYMNYFVARILQFQMYRGLCIAAGQYDPKNKEVPLHKCDFYQSKQAGERLRRGLSLGASRHWRDALAEITGERNLDASALLEYYMPLMEYLKKQNSFYAISTDDDDNNQTVPIVVGSILGAFLVLAIGIYGYKRYKHR